MIEQLLEQAKDHWLNVGAFAFLLILIPIRGWIRNIALEKIKKQFDKDEHVVYEPSLPFMIEFLAPFLFGGGVLELILSHDDFPILLGIRIFCALGLLLIIFLSICRKYLITNKKVYLIPTLKLNRVVLKLFEIIGIKFFELNISDINSVKSEASSLGTRGLEIETKTGEIMSRLVLDNVNETKFAIDSQMIQS